MRVLTIFSVAVLACACSKEGVGQRTIDAAEPLDDSGAPRRGYADSALADTAADVIPDTMVDTRRADSSLPEAQSDSSDLLRFTDSVQADLRTPADFGPDAISCTSLRPYLVDGACVECRDSSDCASKAFCVSGQCEPGLADAGSETTQGKDAISDMGGADLPIADASPETFQTPDLHADTRPAPCPECPDPAWACTACMDDRLTGYPFQPIAIICIEGASYDCNGQLLHVAFGEICPQSKPAQLCLGCNDTAGITCDPAFPDCLKNIRCPDVAPYCNQKTGECSATPVN